MEEKTEKKFSLTDVQKLNSAMIEHAAMATDVGEVKSFPLELEMIASVLREVKMPQEMIHRVLAVRCGLPLVPIDAKSPYFAWVEDEIDLTHRKAFEEAKNLSVDEAERLMATFLAKATSPGVAGTGAGE